MKTIHKIIIWLIFVIVLGVIMSFIDKFLLAVIPEWNKQILWVLGFWMGATLVAFFIQKDNDQ